MSCHQVDSGEGDVARSSDLLSEDRLGKPTLHAEEEVVSSSCDGQWGGGRKLSSQLDADPPDLGLELVEKGWDRPNSQIQRNG